MHRRRDDFAAKLSRRRLFRAGGAGVALSVAGAGLLRAKHGVLPWAATTAEAVTRAGMLQIAGVTDDGGLWHAIRNADGTWTQIGDVKAQAGDPGKIIAVSAAQVDGQVPGGQCHVVIATDDGGLWHAIRFVDGTWQPFGDVKAQAGNIGNFVAVSALEVNSGDLQVIGAIRNGNLFHTIRFTDGTWQPWGNVKDQVGNPGRFVAIATG